MKEFCLLLFRVLDQWTNGKEGRERIVRFGKDSITIQARTRTHSVGCRFSYEQVLTIVDPKILIGTVQNRLAELDAKA